MSKQPPIRPSEGSRRFADAVKDQKLADVAHRLGVDPTTIGRWLKGARKPDVDQAAKIELDTGIPARLWGLPPFTESAARTGTEG